MAKEIVTWCDPCLGEDVRTPSKQYGPFMGKTLDLCDPHADQYVKPLIGLLEEFGAPVELAVAKGRHPSVAQARSVPPNGAQATLIHFETTGTRKGRKPDGDRPWLCLWCPMTYAADSGFRSHLAHAHGITSGLGAFSSVPCPLCGESYDMLGAHVSRAHPEHGFQNVTQAFVWAATNGDPHGSYAAILGLAPVLG